MLSVYIHIPFCRRKCDYCDFFSVPLAGPVPAGYVDLLIRQVQLYAEDPRWRGPVSTLFLGGGTPSLLAAPDLRRLLQAVAATFGFTPAAELTLEANPETVSPALLAAFRLAGINRLSLGVQSTDAAALTLLGRGHDVAMAANAVRWAQAAGFAQVGVDLIFGIPGVTDANLHTGVNRVLDWGVQHLSCYGLTFESQTPLALRRQRGLVLPVGEEVERRQFLGLHDQLTAAGFAHYEISNYARPGEVCRHNQAYWQRLPVLALGAGAHAYVDRGWGERWAAPAALDRYQQQLRAGQDPLALLESLDRQTAMNETCYLALRTADGIDAAAFCQRFGQTLQQAYPRAQQRLGTALVTDAAGWRLTPEGWLLYDHLVQEFL